MNTRCKLIRVAAAIVVTFCSVTAQEIETPAFRVGLDLWSTTGDSDWQTAFTAVDPVLGTAFGGSSLVWDDLDSEMAVVTAEVGLSSHFSLMGRYGFGSISGGVSTDSDFITVPRLGVDNLLLSESIADTGGDTVLYDIALYCALSSLFGRPASAADIGVFVGYQCYEDELNMRSGVQTAFAGESLYEPFPAPLDSDFDFKWEGIRAGALIRVPLAYRFDLAGSLAMVLEAEYEGEGYWNLRDDLRRTAPNFAQSADSGTGLELAVSVSYRPWEHLGLRLGYDILDWKAEDGRNEIFLADGSSEVMELEEVNSSRSGVFGGVFGQW